MKKKIEENILVCKAVTFYCDKDEDAFFEWIKKIDCIEKISGAGNELYLHICADDIHEYDLRDLLGLFRRYNVDMKQLSRFLTDENKKWFKNPIMAWHKKVFGK